MKNKNNIGRLIAVVLLGRMLSVVSLSSIVGPLTASEEEVLNPTDDTYTDQRIGKIKHTNRFDVQISSLILFTGNIRLKIMKGIYSFLTMTLATIERINPIAPIEKKLLRIRSPSTYVTATENIKPINPRPAPRVIKNLPVPILFLPINKPPAITAIPPNEAMKIKITNTI